MRAEFVRSAAKKSSLPRIEAQGGFVSREEILREIWDNCADAGVINVYVHYLREKIEHGEKIIISSRNNGYKIDEKYFTEVENA